MGKHLAFYGSTTSSAPLYENAFSSRSQIFSSTGSTSGNNFDVGDTLVSSVISGSYVEGEPLTYRTDKSRKVTRAQKGGGGGSTSTYKTVEERVGFITSSSYEAEEKATRSDSGNTVNDGESGGETRNNFFNDGGGTRVTSSYSADRTITIRNVGSTATKSKANGANANGSGNFDGGGGFNFQRTQAGAGNSGYTAGNGETRANGIINYQGSNNFNNNFTSAYGRTARDTDAEGNVDSTTRSGGDSNPQNGGDNTTGSGEYTPQTYKTSFEDEIDATTTRTINANSTGTKTVEFTITEITTGTSDETETTAITGKSTRLDYDDAESFEQTVDGISISTSEGTINTLQNTVPSMALQTWQAFGPLGFVTVSTSDPQTVKMTDLVTQVVRTMQIDPGFSNIQFVGSTEQPNTPVSATGYVFLSETKTITYTNSITVEKTTTYTGRTFNDDYEVEIKQATGSYRDEATTTYSRTRNVSLFPNDAPLPTTSEGTTYTINSTGTSRFTSDSTLKYFEDGELKTIAIPANGSKTSAGPMTKIRGLRVVQPGQTFFETVGSSVIEESVLTNFDPRVSDGACNVFTGKEHLMGGYREAPEIAYMYETTDRISAKNAPPSITTFDTTTIGEGTNTETTSTNSGTILFNYGAGRTASTRPDATFFGVGSVEILLSDTTLTIGSATRLIKQNGSTGRIGKTFFEIEETGQEYDLMFSRRTLTNEPAGKEGGGQGEQIIFAGGKNNQNFTGLLSARGPGQLHVGSTFSTNLTFEEYFTSELDSSEPYAIKNIAILTGQPDGNVLGGQGFTTTDLNNYNPYQTGQYFGFQ
jgi:hypothetical protein